MTKEKTYYLEDGIDALNDGRKREARRLLAAAIRENPRDETAWLGMAHAVEEEEKYIDCMQHVLAINPENEIAQKALDKYKKSQRLSTVGEKLGRYGILAMIALIVVCVPLVLFSNAVSDIFSPRSPTPSRISIEFTQTNTIQALFTAVPTLTITPIPPTLTLTLSPSPTIENEEMRFFPCIPDSSPLLAEVTEVISGDTIEVLLSGTKFVVGYIGVDSPEVENVYGEEAAEVNQSLVVGQEVMLFPDVSEFDENGRLMRYVFVREMFVNYEILRLGYARAVERPPDTACNFLFFETAQGAKNNGQGLWAFIDLDEMQISTTEETAEP